MCDTTYSYMVRVLYVPNQVFVVGLPCIIGGILPEPTNAEEHLAVVINCELLSISGCKVLEIFGCTIALEATQPARVYRHRVIVDDGLDLIHVKALCGGDGKRACHGGTVKQLEVL